MRLDKPIGILLLLWPTLWALWLSARGEPDWRVVWIFVLGTVLMRSAGCVINDLADRNFDPHVERTSDRPLASGQVSPRKPGCSSRCSSFAQRSWSCRSQLACCSACRWPRSSLPPAIPSPSASSRIPQAYLGVAFGFGIPMAYAAQLGQRAAGSLVAAAGQRLLGDRLRHRVRDGRPRRRPEDRHQAPRRSPSAAPTWRR
jgi:4-hydroxybenzoate polyprenyltransferase